MINGLIGLIIIAMNISVYYMLDSIQEISELREKEIFMKKNLEVQTQNVQNIRDKFTQIRRVIHDSEKHLKSIRNFLRYPEAMRTDRLIFSLIIRGM